MQKTRRAILDYLKRHPGATLDELARVTGTAPITARGHVNVLVDQCLLAAKDIRGHRGRPFRRYYLTEEAEQHFPKQYDRLAASLLSSMAELQGPAAVSALMEHAAARMAEDHRERVTGRSLEERVAAVSEIIDEQGGATDWERTAEAYVMRERNCPYLSVSRQDEYVCELDRQVISRLAGADVTVTQRLRDGAASCVFVIARDGQPEAS